MAPSLRYLRYAPLLLVLGFLAAACSSSPSGPSGSSCDTPVSFTVLPVPLSAIQFATPIGNMGPPVHTIPTDHVGLYLTGTGIPLVAPGALRVTEVDRTRYLVSPFRQGQSDYAVGAQLCQNHQLRFGHVVTIAASLQSQVSTTNCTTYSTANETVESCRNGSANVSLAAGDAIGTVGGVTAGAFDVGLYDLGHQNVFVNPSRYSGFTLNAVCPYDFFSAGLSDQLYARIGDGVHAASGEAPRCGSMSVDVAGTAQGAWVLQSNPVSQAGDETSFAVLAPHPLSPVSHQTFSMGPPTLQGNVGAGLDSYPVTTTGRVNRRFGGVGADGLIYCYVPDPEPTVRFSYFIRLAASGVLTLQKVTHLAGGSPCRNDPATWAFDASALGFIR